MNKYRRFKYPFGGETPEEFAAARQQYYQNISDDTYRQLNSIPSNVKHVDANSETREYINRTGQQVQKYINSQNNQPDTRKGKLIRNHDNKYDYYKVGDRLYTRRKGTDTWTDISDNKAAVNIINSYLRNNSSNKSNTSSNTSSTNNTRVAEAKTYDAGTLNDVVITGTRHNTSSSPRRVQGSTAYKATPQTQEDRYRKGKPGYIITRGAQKAIDFVKSLANKERNDNSNGYISRSQYMAKYHRDRLNQK